MKTLKQILEVYKPNSADEKKFVDKHIVVKQKDRNGNGDDVFQATNIKTVGRKDERHGYDPNEDEKVYEETLQEEYEEDDTSHLGKVTGVTINQKNKNSYRVTQHHGKGVAVHHDFDNEADAMRKYSALRKKHNITHYGETNEEFETLDEISGYEASNGVEGVAGSAARKAGKAAKVAREKGDIKTAEKREGQRQKFLNYARKKTNEQIDSDGILEITEKLKVSDGVGKWVSDFVHSDNPKFAGKSKKERTQMALGAFYSAKRGE